MLDTTSIKNVLWLLSALYLSYSVVDSFSIIETTFRKNSGWHSRRKRSQVPLNEHHASLRAPESNRTIDEWDLKADYQTLQENLTEYESPLVSAIESLFETEISENQYNLPWTEVQQWALRDNLPRFTIQVPIGRNGMEVYILWRNLCEEVPEIAGYPIEFLQDHCLRLESKSTPPSMLPKVPLYLDNFQFEANGGLTGNIYGLPGISDGSRITTNLLYEAEKTIPKRYALAYTDAGRSGSTSNCIVYELGKALQANNHDVYSLDGTTKRMLTTAGMNNIPARPFDLIADKKLSIDNDNNIELLYLGGLTATLLTGAYAIQILSHHLTVNVFWV